MTQVERLVFMIVLIAVMASSIGAIYSKYASRKSFTEIEKLTNELDQYEVEWGQLQLEQNMLATHARIERLAIKKLGMAVPDRESIVYLKSN